MWKPVRHKSGWTLCPFLIKQEIAVAFLGDKRYDIGAFNAYGDSTDGDASVHLHFSQSF